LGYRSVNARPVLKASSNQERTRNMGEVSDDKPTKTTSRTASGVRSRPTSLVAYAASAWAFAFAAMSLYWAAGGTFGVGTQADSIRELAVTRPAWFVATLWVTGVMKATAGLIALALVRPWGRAIPPRMVVVAAWGTGVLLALYGGANLAVRAMMGLGVLSTPESMRSAAARWHLLVWDPWWLLGGILFCAAAWTYPRYHRRRAGDRRAESSPRR
jgi:hypothetical protein